MPLTIASICFSVSIPPARCAKAGIDVPRTPSAMIARIDASSTIARYTGLASAIAAPPRPLAPWQPAQLSAYSASNSDDLVRRQRHPSLREAGRAECRSRQAARPAWPRAPSMQRDVERAFTTVALSSRRHRSRRLDARAQGERDVLAASASATAERRPAPATMPKATCDAMNQNQSMRLASSGFRRLEHRMQQSRPQHRDDQSAEDDRPPREHRQHRAIEQSHERGDEAVHAHGDGEAVEMKRIQFCRSELHRLRRKPPPRED